MDNSEEIDSSEEKMSSVKGRINSSFRKPKQFSVRSVEQNGDQIESNSTSVDVLQKKDKKEKKMMVVYLPVDIPTGRSRSRRNQEGEHFLDETVICGRQQQKEDQKMCSTYEVPESVTNGEMCTLNYRPSHYRMRSNPNLTMLVQQKEAQPQPEAVIPRRKHSFTSKLRPLPTGKSLRNTWSSLTEPNSSIKIVATDSPNSPKRTSMNSLDICLTTPLQYSRHRSQQKTLSTASRRLSSPIFHKAKHHFFPYISQSSAEENRENSVTPTEVTTPPNPYQSVLSFSFNVSDTDLDLSGDTKVIRMDVTPTRRLKSTHSISPKVEEGQLIDVSDTAHLGSTINVKDDFDSLDLSDLTPCTKTILTPEIENNREAQDTLIELIDNNTIQHEWDGEELVGSNDDEENMIFYNSDQNQSEEKFSEDENRGVETVETPKTAPDENGMSYHPNRQQQQHKKGGGGGEKGEKGGGGEEEEEEEDKETKDMAELECFIHSPKGSLAGTREPSPIPLEKPETPVQHVSPYHTVDPLCFSLRDYFLHSPEDQENAERYKKQLELEEQQKIARRKELERIQVEPVLEVLESPCKEDGGTEEEEILGKEILRKFEEEFSKRMRQKEEEENRKREELRKSADLVGTAKNGVMYSGVSSGGAKQNSNKVESIAGSKAWNKPNNSTKAADY